MESACRARIKPATKQEIPFALSLLNGVVRESDQMESLKPSRDVIMSTADTPERRLGGDGDAERVEKLATCVAPTARSSRGGFCWRGRFPLVRRVSVGAATPVCTTAFCRSDASRELFGRTRTPPDPARPVPVRTVAFCRSDASRELFGPTSPMSAEGRMVEPFSSAVGRAAHAAASPRAREGVRIRR